MKNRAKMLIFDDFAENLAFKVVPGELPQFQS